eukprot:UN15287
MMAGAGGFQRPNPGMYGVGGHGPINPIPAQRGPGLQQGLRQPHPGPMRTGPVPGTGPAQMPPQRNAPPPSRGPSRINRPFNVQSKSPSKRK